MSIIIQNDLVRADLKKLAETNPARALDLTDKFAMAESDNQEREKFMCLALQIQPQILRLEKL